MTHEEEMSWTRRTIAYQNEIGDLRRRVTNQRSELRRLNNISMWWWRAVRADVQRRMHDEELEKLDRFYKDEIAAILAGDRVVPLDAAADSGGVVQDSKEIRRAVFKSVREVELAGRPSAEDLATMVNVRSK